MKRALLLVLAAALLVPGCGDDSASETTAAADAVTVRVYFLRDGKVWPVAREVEEASVSAAMAELIAGPTEQERADLGLSTSLSPELRLEGVSVNDGVVDVDLSGDRADGLAQIVYTLTQFAHVNSVALVEGDYALTGFDRPRFEEETPSVLVESPLSFEEVQTPLRVTGTANTFEANFQYELLDADGNVVDKNFVTATSGTGTRGTFEFTTADVDDVATLVVFESSAEDGSRMNEVEIPLTVAP